MIRTLAPLAVALALCAAAAAQYPVIRTGGVMPQPQGVIPTPSLPSVGALTAPSPVGPPRVLPRPFAVAAPYYGPWGYSPYWPVWYDYDPVPVMSRVVPVPMPVYTPPIQTTVVVAEAPKDVRARLALTIPLGSRVWLAGKEVDANAAPTVLESPVLQTGQSYTFDVKVAWADGGKTEERTRSVTVGAGDQTSLTYQK